MPNDPARLRRQMARRGWTAEQLEEAKARGVQFSAVNRETKGAVTRYVHPGTGRSVIIDDATGEFMSAGTASRTETIYVRLLEEAVDVWRPVEARALGGDQYKVLDQPIPEDEIWEFAPGDRVTVRTRKSETGEYAAAVSKVPRGKRIKQH